MNYVLIGMPACGKSTIGVILAKTINMHFIDTDLLIQEEENDLLQNIINTQGMDEFLKIEERVLSSLATENSIISTGGSAVYSDAAMKNLSSHGTVIYIKLPLTEIESRLNNITTRGIAMKQGETLADLYDRRVPLYEKYADITIEADNLTAEECIEKILGSISHIG